MKKFNRWKKINENNYVNFFYWNKKVLKYMHCYENS